MSETRRVSRSWCSKLYTYVSIFRLSTSHLYPHPDMWNLVYQWLESGTMSWDICDHLCPTTNLANHTQTSGSVLIVSASCILASLSPTACRCLAQCFAVDLDFWLPRRKIWKAFSKLHSKYLCLARIKITVMYVNCSWALFQTAHLLQAAERGRLASTLV